MSKSQTFNSLKTQKYHKNELQVQKTCLCEISHHEIVNPGALYCCGEASLNYFIYSWDRWFHRVTIKLRGCDMIVEGWKEEKSYSLFISDMTFFIFLIYSHGILINHWQLISVHFPIMASINLKKTLQKCTAQTKKVQTLWWPSMCEHVVSPSLNHSSTVWAWWILALSSWNKWKRKKFHWWKKPGHSVYSGSQLTSLFLDTHCWT